MTGWFAAWRWALVWVTQLAFYGGAWLTWNDRQAILFDIVHRKFYIFGLVFWPQDIIYLTVLLIVAALSLFLFTAVAGRLWCGYACPQTVYTEIFMWIERVIEGDRVQRMKLDRGSAEHPQARPQGGKARDLDRARALDRLHLRRLLHADPRAVGRGDDALRRVPGKRSGCCSTASPPTATPAGCASRCASTCARTRASRARCSTRTR